MAHKFDSKNKHKLDNEKRRSIMPPYETLKSMGLKQGDIMADVGSGMGYFTFPAAEIVEKEGKVYAMDISIDMLEHLERKTSEDGISNIRAIKVDEDDFKTEDDLFDFVLISNVLHEAEDKVAFITELKRILKSDGTIAIIEWEKIKGDAGPPEEDRIDKAALEDLLKNQEFVIKKRIEIGTDFYGIAACNCGHK